MPGKGVEIHPRGRPVRIQCDFRPLFCGQWLSREQTKRHARQGLGTIRLPGLELLHDGGKQGGVVRSADDPGVESLAAGATRFRVNHFDHIGERWIVTDGGSQQRFIRGEVEPLTDQTPRSAAERFPAGDTGANGLHEVPQESGIVDDFGENVVQTSKITRGEHSAQQGGHVFHVSHIPSIQGGASEEIGIHLAGEFQRAIQLCFGSGIKGLREATGAGELGESSFGGKLIGGSTGIVGGRGRPQGRAKGREECFVHVGVWCCCDPIGMTRAKFFLDWCLRR